VRQPGFNISQAPVGVLAGLPRLFDAALNLGAAEAEKSRKILLARPNQSTAITAKFSTMLSQ
jgi:hypothetical protein